MNTLLVWFTLNPVKFYCIMLAGCVCFMAAMGTIIAKKK